MRLDELHNIIEKIVFENYKYVVPRRGQIVDIVDPEEKGRVLVVIPSLGWNSNDKGVWCRPMDVNALKTPKVDDWVIVQWVDANPDDAIYIGIDTKLTGMLPSNYEPQVDVLYDDDTIIIKIDKSSGQILIDGMAEVIIGQGTESFVLGDTLDAYLQSLKTYIDSHAHTGVTTGGGTSGPPSPSPSLSNIKSKVIKGE